MKRNKQRLEHGLAYVCICGLITLMACFVFPVSESASHHSATTSFQAVHPAVPIVRNRDTSGRFIRPHCPLCDAVTATTCEAWRCANGHRFETADQPLQ